MNVLQALVLGLVQGLTEFIPVSSSGHLTLVPFIIGWDEPTLAFTVASHIGTLGAVSWIFRETIRGVLRTIVNWREAAEPDRRLVRLLFIASVPAVIVGVVFEAAIGEAIESPVLVSFLLGLTGYFLTATDTIVEAREVDPVEGQRASRDVGDISDTDAAAIGIAQAVAILPGISRSGSTIGVAMRRGISRRGAATFSFLMSIPIIFGAALFQVPDMIGEMRGGDALPFLVGLVASAASGFWAVRWFLGVIERRGLRPFGVYCLLAMVAGLLTGLARG